MSKRFIPGVAYGEARGKKLTTTGLYYFGARYYDAELGRWIP